MKDALIMGIDGGGTKTAFAVTSLDGHIIEYFTYGASNPNDIGRQKALSLISEGIAKAVNKYPDISTVFCGIAGAATGGHIDFFEKELAMPFPKQKIVINSDFENIFGICDDCDIAIISGTGSVVCVKQNEKYSMLGGWGNLFDKAGSAYDIGREAVFVSLEEEELQKEPSFIRVLLQERLKCSNVRSTLSELYKGGKPYIASLADTVFQAYMRKDKKAEEIIDKNAQRLAELLNSAIKQFNVSPHAVSGGGLFEHYGEIMLRHISKYTNVKITIPKCPPIYGACRVCRKLFDKNVPDDFEQNFITSFNNVLIKE